MNQSEGSKLSALIDEGLKTASNVIMKNKEIQQENKTKDNMFNKTKQQYSEKIQPKQRRYKNIGLTESENKLYRSEIQLFLESKKKRNHSFPLKNFV